MGMIEYALSTGEMHVITDAENDVIDAAEEWLDLRDGPSDERLRIAMSELKAQREALLAAEGEE